MNPASWRGLVDGLIEAVLLVDALSLRIVEANEEASRLLGSSRDRLIGASILDFAVTPEDNCFWEDAAAGRSTGIFSESKLRVSDGSFRDVDRRVSMIRLSGQNALFVVGLSDQTDHRRAEDELEKLVAELRATLESTADGILVTDSSDRIRGFNNRFAELWELPLALRTHRDDAAVFGTMTGAVVDRDAYIERLGILNRSPLLECRDVIVLRSGRVLERVSLPQYARGRPIGRVYSFRDITRQLVDEARLKLAAKVFESSLDAIFIASTEHVIVAVNPGCTRLMEHAETALVGMKLGDLFFDPESDRGITPAIEALGIAGYWEGEFWFRRASGSCAPGLISMVCVQDTSSASVADAQLIVIVKDLSERLAANKRIEELAYKDALTGLPNRNLLGERMRFALGLAGREITPLAVMFLDLDRFKQINDSLGHMFGDRVIVEVARRISSCLRTADTAARLGGDEFVILLHDTDARGAEATARRINDALGLPMAIDEMLFSVSSSIGIAMFPEDGTTMDELIKNADTAMYQVKERGRSDFRFYQRQMNIDLLSRMKIEHAMRQGLEGGAFRLHFQPQVALEDGRVIGAEALLRWHDSELGDVSPARFIPIAEECGFISILGDWVMNEAIRQVAAWRQIGIDLPVAINVSALQFHQNGFVDGLRQALDSAGVPASRIEVELTESILVQDAEEALIRLHGLAALGVKISIDDFGTGYSSLTYLKKFPIQKLKIDRSFVMGLPEDENDAAIAQVIIQLGRAMRLQIIAEGVETEEQRACLLALGCGECQGFLYARALDPEAFVDFLRRDRTGASRSHAA